VLAYVLLGLAQVIGLLMIPFGAPGVWLMIAALAAFGWWTGFALVGPIPILLLAVVALAAELAALTLSSGTFDERFRRRVAFSGFFGGGAGAAIGIPLPLPGSLFGAFFGALIGSLLGTLGARAVQTEGSGCAAIGGLLVATSMRTAAGFAVAASTFFMLSR
jgi:hypothetical protein